MSSERKAKQLEIYGTAVSENMNWINSVLIYGSIVMSIVVVAKLLTASTFKWNDVDIPVDLVWVFVVALTFAHSYATNLLFESASKFYEASDPSDRSLLFEKLSRTGGLAYRGLRARVLVPGTNLHKIDRSEPTAWLFLGMALLVPAAIVPFRAMTIFELFFYPLMSSYLVFQNWWIGSKWGITLSELAGLPTEDGELYRRSKDYMGQSFMGPIHIPPFHGALTVAIIPTFIALVGYLIAWVSR